MYPYLLRKINICCKNKNLVIQSILLKGGEFMRHKCVQCKKWLDYDNNKCLYCLGFGSREAYVLLYDNGLINDWKIIQIKEKEWNN